MQMRLVYAKALPGQTDAFRRTYETIVLPVLEKTPGCLAAGLLQHTKNSDELISITSWRSQQDATAYEQSGTFRSLVDAMRPVLADSTEWHLQLSDDLTLEYVPLPAEPVVQSTTVAAESTEKGGEPVTVPGLFIRLVSMKLKQGMAEEFRNRYAAEVIPALQQTPGCRHAYLTMGGAGGNDALSITVWNSREAAAAYEASGLFTELLEQLQPAFSGVTQWKMAVDRLPQIQAATSDDITVEGFQTIVAKEFRKGSDGGLS